MTQKLQILEFIKNRNKEGESTTLRHIHRRFGLDYESIEEIISSFLQDELIYRFYDEDFEEYRFLPKIDDQ